MKERIENAITDLDIKKGDSLFVTLTAHYEKTKSGIFSSWRTNQKELPRTLQRLRRLGFKSYIWVREAFEEGGCHVHIIIKKKNCKFQYFRDQKNPAILRLDDEELRAKIKCTWKGHVDIQVISDENAANYISKEIGKTSHIEEALKRAKKGEDTAGDRKKLYAHAMSKKLKIRRWGVSRDLIKHMTNPSEELPEIELKEYYILPNSIIRAPFFEPYNQTVDRKTLLYEKLNDFFNEMKILSYHCQLNTRKAA